MNRTSFLYGVSGGLAFGLAHFLFTSRTLRSVNYSVYSFSMITIGYWMHCRYNYSKTKFEVMRLQEMLEKQAMLEGTDQFPQTNQQPEIVDV
ncbi:cytochrome c oxidase assembly factor COX20 lethal (3) 87Df isoform X2 [Rhynchophorus ferrugineus]|uniref:Cytochrome c oxidase assembly protein COX20, mitochondrial n=1 Tax=Rhynchophorus ferrugineus TaxID=354439 RepID=A0A834MC21_RHYFE|nr:hypothetical protein GWI33_012902 [Rhynchophorus ferrugineus]